MNAHGKIKLGLIGSGIALICCFTPVLVVLLGLLGIGGYAAGLDLVLIPALIGFSGLVLVGLIEKKRGR